MHTLCYVPGHKHPWKSCVCIRVVPNSSTRLRMRLRMQAQLCAVRERVSRPQPLRKSNHYLILLCLNLIERDDTSALFNVMCTKIENSSLGFKSIT